MWNFNLEKSVMEFYCLIIINFNSARSVLHQIKTCNQKVSIYFSIHWHTAWNSTKIFVIWVLVIILHGVHVKEFYNAAIVFYQEKKLKKLATRKKWIVILAIVMNDLSVLYGVVTKHWQLEIRHFYTFYVLT